MKLNNPWFHRAGGFALAKLSSLHMSTLDFQGAFTTEDLDPAFSDPSEPVIYLMWHEYCLFYLYLRGGHDITLLVSQHGDAEWLVQAGNFWGFDSARGSSTRGGVQVLRKLMRDTKNNRFAITPDGPVGPRREMAAGAVFLASKLGAAVICAGVGYERPWRIRRSWDQFAVPRPFSRACTVVGPKIHVPKRLARGGLERYRLHIQETLNRYTECAEEWARTGKPVEHRRSLWKHRTEPRKPRAHDVSTASLELPQAKAA